MSTSSNSKSVLWLTKGNLEATQKKHEEVLPKIQSLVEMCRREDESSISVKLSQVISLFTDHANIGGIIVELFTGMQTRNFKDPRDSSTSTTTEMMKSTSEQTTFVSLQAALAILSVNVEEKTAHFRCQQQAGAEMDSEIAKLDEEYRAALKASKEAKGPQPNSKLDEDFRRLVDGEPATVEEIEMATEVMEAMEAIVEYNPIEKLDVSEKTKKGWFVKLFKKVN